VTVKEVLGHADIKTTMCFAHTNREAKTSGVSAAVVTMADPTKKTKKSA
jgi:site-specific recombinase XerC